MILDCPSSTEVASWITRASSFGPSAFIWSTYNPSWSRNDDRLLGDDPLFAILPGVETTELDRIEATHFAGLGFGDHRVRQRLQLPGAASRIFAGSASPDSLESTATMLDG